MAAGPDCSGEGGGVADVPPATTPDEPVCAVTDEALDAALEGPKEAAVAEPPATTPGADEALVIPERI